MRVAVLGFLLVMLAEARPAEARRGGGIVVINVGDDIMHVRQTSPEAATNEDGSAAELDQIGYHYSRFGLFWVDLWRWEGEWVLYSSDGGSYAPISDAELEQLGGARFPLAYHLPPGFLLLVCGGYFLIVRRKPRTVKFALIAGGILIAIALILFLLGLGLGALIPGFLGVYHLFAAKFSPAGSHEEDDEAPAENYDGAEPEPEPRPRREPAPRVETDPFRAPPQQAPIMVERPSQPIVAPIAVDPNAEAPKLLR